MGLNSGIIFSVQKADVTDAPRLITDVPNLTPRPQMPDISHLPASISQGPATADNVVRIDEFNVTRTLNRKYTTQQVELAGVPKTASVTPILVPAVIFCLLGIAVMFILHRIKSAKKKTREDIEYLATEDQGLHAPKEVPKAEDQFIE